MPPTPKEMENKETNKLTAFYFRGFSEITMCENVTVIFYIV